MSGMVISYGRACYRKGGGTGVTPGGTVKNLPVQLLGEAAKNGGMIRHVKGNGKLGRCKDNGISEREGERGKEEGGGGGEGGGRKGKRGESKNRKK